MQIRRSSYHNAVKVFDIENDLDITGIQTYVINSFNVVFLNKRDLENPKSRRAGKSCKHSSQCETCRRNISDSYQFCSLGCKYAWVQKSEIESGMSESGSGSTVMSTNKAEGKRKREEEKITETWSPQEMKSFSEQIPKKRVPKSRKTSLNNLPLQTTDEVDSSSRKNKTTSNSNKRKGVPCRAPLF
ncbi:uncharacterized protein At3g50808 [Cajanus cajan]|uniref:uncharacterized protein At3g50808 n=1 Tax=Cajanus cajan TaxID=3821 RepID=UPI00098DA8CF|nr:uncharacterized protein At3g50808 [Cajanus cajan]